MLKITLLVLTISLAGCSLFVEKPEVSVKNVNFKGLDRNGVGVDLLLAVSNPNSFRLTMNGYSYELFINEMPLTRGEGHDTVDFAPNSITDVHLPVRVGFQELSKIFEANVDLAQIPYRLKAGLHMKTILGTRTIPVEKKGSFTLPRRLFLDRLLKQLK